MLEFCYNMNYTDPGSVQHRHLKLLFDNVRVHWRHKSIQKSILNNSFSKSNKLKSNLTTANYKRRRSFILKLWWLISDKVSFYLILLFKDFSSWFNSPSVGLELREVTTVAWRLLFPSPSLTTCWLDFLQDAVCFSRLTYSMFGSRACYWLFLHRSFSPWTSHWSILSVWTIYLGPRGQMYSNAKKLKMHLGRSTFQHIPFKNVTKKKKKEFSTPLPHKTELLSAPTGQKWDCTRQKQ